MYLLDLIVVKSIYLNNNFSYYKPFVIIDLNKWPHSTKTTMLPNSLDFL